MDIRVKNLWLAALRDGEYVQGRWRLCTEGDDYDTFCCLGVLCNIYAEEKDIDWEELHKDDQGSSGLSFIGHSADLPPEVAEWAGLPSRNPLVNEKYLGSSTSLASLNDVGHSFIEIADVIENNL